MPNVGRASRDCQTCRQRRLKCDLVRPECSQCLRKGLSCPGYRDEIDMRFRINSVSSVQATLSKPRRGPSNSDNTTCKCDSLMVLEAGRTSHQRPASSMSLVSKRCSPLANPLTESWDVHSLPFAISKLETVYFMCPEVFETALRLFSSMNQTSHLNLVCKAVASAFLANTTKSTQAMAEQAKAYSKSLVAVYSAIRDPRQVRSDDTFMSICLLAFYEVITGAQTNKKSYLYESRGYKAHTKALVDLIGMRGPQMCATRDARNLIGMTHCHLQARSLLHSLSAEKPPSFMLHYYRQCSPDEYEILRSYIYSYHCTYLCRRMQTLLEADIPDALLANSPSIIQAIDEVEQQVYPFSKEQAKVFLKIESPLELSISHDQLSEEQLRLRRHQYITRLLLSSYAVDFVSYALKLASCTTKQRRVFEQLRQRYMVEIDILSKRLPTFDGASSDLGSYFAQSIQIKRISQGEEVKTQEEKTPITKINDHGTQNGEESADNSLDMIWQGLLVLAGCDDALLKSPGVTNPKESLDQLRL